MVYQLILEKDLSIKEENLSMLSEVQLEFRSIQEQSSVKSQKFTLPEIDASWWFEINPVYKIARSNLTFPSVTSPEESLIPEIKLKFEFHDETIYTSNLFTVSVYIVELNSCSSPSMRTNFITDHVVNINSKTLEISSKSFECCAKEYTYQCNYLRQGLTVLVFNLRCKLTFKFTGKFAESFSNAVKMLKNVASKSNENLLKDDSFSDFTIIAGDESFKVHKCILASASSVFKTMFTCGLDETKLNSTTFNCKPEIIGHLLKFIYEGALPSNEQLKSSSGVCIDLHEFAHRYEIRILKEICKSYAMQLTINKKNALKIYEFASTYEIQSLLDSSWEIVKTNLLEIEKPCNPISLPKVKEAMVKKSELLEIFERRTKELLFEDDDKVTGNPQTDGETQPDE